MEMNYGMKTKKLKVNNDLQGKKYWHIKSNNWRIQSINTSLLTIEWSPAKT